MKSSILGTLFLFLFVSTTLRSADCIYDQPLTAKQFQIGILLTWSTLSEQNNDRFYVEVSADGTDFSELGSVPGAGTSDRPTAYQYLDIRPERPVSYYRLRQVDSDGSSSHTPVVVYRQAGSPRTTSLVRVSDVFTENTIQLSIHATSPQTITLKTYDLQNRLIESRPRTLGHGLNEIVVDVAALEPGIYRLELWTEELLTERLSFKRVKEGTYPVGEQTPVARKQ